jgi:hypothetical protein
MVEQALVFASIIVGIGVTDMLMSLHRLLRARHRVRWDWAPLAVAALVLLTVVQIWWSIAGARTGPLTIGFFLPTLVELIILFLLAAAVLPDEVPQAGIDLRQYYHDNGSYIWSLYAAALGWLLVVNLAALITRGASVFQILNSMAMDVFVCALMVSLIFVRRRWWHLLVLLILLLGPLKWLSRSLS